MKGKGKYIQLVALLILVIFLYGFSQAKNAERMGKIKIEFTNGEHLLLSKQTVNNLLITKKTKLKNQPIDSITLYSLEKELDNQPMVANSEIFRNIIGDTNIMITQRTPIARFIEKSQYYIDAEGNKMPLSKIYTVRVPIVSGADSQDIDSLYPLLKKISQDSFLIRNITSIHKTYTGDYILRLRQNTMKINFGKVTKVNEKIDNFKAFYKKMLLDKKLDYYSKVNLKYANQVVCTKKES